MSERLILVCGRLRIFSCSFCRASSAACRREEEEEEEEEERKKRGKATFGGGGRGKKGRSEYRGWGRVQPGQVGWRWVGGWEMYVYVYMRPGWRASWGSWLLPPSACALRARRAAATVVLLTKGGKVGGWERQREREIPDSRTGPADAEDRHASLLTPRALLLVRGGCCCPPGHHLGGLISHTHTDMDTNAIHNNP